MPTAVAMPVQEYLDTPFEYAPDYVEGELIERSMPSTRHARTQTELNWMVRNGQATTGLYPYSELHLPVTSARYRVADLAIFHGPADEPYPQRPALAVFEIVSPRDVHSELLERLSDYHAWGVSHIWLIDPDHRTIHRFDGASLLAESSIDLPAHGFHLSAAGLFALLD